MKPKVKRTKPIHWTKNLFFKGPKKEKRHWTKRLMKYIETQEEKGQKPLEDYIDGQKTIDDFKEVKKSTNK